MANTKTILYVDGMTCGSCESHIVKALLGLDGVSLAAARRKTGEVQVEYDDALVTISMLRETIEKTGYVVRTQPKTDSFTPLLIGALLILLYLHASFNGLFTFLPAVDSSFGYAMLFLAGLLTSIHCVAMCGGIALSQSIPRVQNDAAGSVPFLKERFEKLQPSLRYNAGRMLSYTVIGGIAGALGSAFSFSPVTKGIIAGIAGILMVFFALQMFGLFSLPALAGKLLPRALGRAFSKPADFLRTRGPFAVGILNGFMPCGPLQTMQLYALGTGSAITGALSMLVFSAGTIPLMLVFGLTSALLPRRFLPIMTRTSAVLVMFLGIITFARAATLAGIPLPELPRSNSFASGNLTAGSSSGGNTSQIRTAEFSAASSESNAPGGGLSATVTGGTQKIVTEFTDGYYVPFTVQAGIPLEWTVRIKAEDITGCNNTLIVPEYGVKKRLVPGDNLITFTPAKAGVIAYSCWMGMIRSRIRVVNAGDTAASGNSGSSDTASVGPILLPDDGNSLQGGSCCRR